MPCGDRQIRMNGFTSTRGDSGRRLTRCLLHEAVNPEGGAKMKWYLRIVAVGIAGSLIVLSAMGIYKTVPEHGFDPGFYRVNRFTGSVVYCRLYTTTGQSGKDTISGATCYPARPD